MVHGGIPPWLVKCLPPWSNHKEWRVKIPCFPYSTIFWLHGSHSPMDSLITDNFWYKQREIMLYLNYSSMVISLTNLRDYQEVVLNTTIKSPGPPLRKPVTVYPLHPVRSSVSNSNSVVDSTTCKHS